MVIDRYFVMCLILALLLGVIGPWLWFSHAYFVPMMLAMGFLICCIETARFLPLLLLATCIGLPAQYQTLSWLFDFQAQFEQPDVGYEALYPIYGLIILQQFLFATLLPSITTFVLVRRCQVMSTLWAAPAVFTLFEALRARVFTGFTLGQPGYGMLDSFWSGVLPISGVLGLTFITWLMVTVVTLGVMVLLARWQRLPNRQLYNSDYHYQYEAVGRMAFIGALSVLLLVPFVTHIAWVKPLQVMPISVVHERADLAMKATVIGRHQRFQQLRSLSLQSSDAELILWPEGSVSSGTGFYGPVQQFAEQLHNQYETELLFGGYHYWDDSEYNAVVRGRDLKSVYKKKHLIPFGEYVPNTWLSGVVGSALDSLAHAQLEAGSNQQPDLTVKGIRFRSFICFEVMFGHSLIALNEDTHVLLYFNDLSWVRDSLLLPQSLIMARVRAMELAKPLVAVSNLGVSAHIKYDGTVTHIETGAEAKILNYQITPQAGMTLYSRYGDQPLVVGLILLILMSVLNNFKNIKLFCAKQKN